MVYDVYNSIPQAYHIRELDCSTLICFQHPTHHILKGDILDSKAQYVGYQKCQIFALHDEREGVFVIFFMRYVALNSLKSLRLVLVLWIMGASSPEFVEKGTIHL